MELSEDEEDSFGKNQISLDGRMRAIDESMNIFLGIRVKCRYILFEEESIPIIWARSLAHMQCEHSH